MPEKLHYSIRDLVPNPDPQFSRAGDSKEHLRHRQVQFLKARKYRSFISEARLSTVLNMEGREIHISGRVDGYRKTRQGVILCEIKPVSGRARDRLHDPALQGARRQLLLYASLAMQADALPWGKRKIVGAELILCGDNNSLASETVDIGGAGSLLQNRLLTYLTSINARQCISGESSAVHEFVQKDTDADRSLQKLAWEHLQKSRDCRLLLSLPPGSGKTRIAIRYAMVRACEENKPVVWITSQSTGRNAVLQELQRFRDAGIRLKAIWKTVPERVCNCRHPSWNCEVRIQTNEKLYWEGLPAELTRGSVFPDDVVQAADRLTLCSHALAHEMEMFSDVLIADLNYLLFGALRGRNVILVIDEAQNACRRILETFQINITNEQLAEYATLLNKTSATCLRQLLAKTRRSENGFPAEEWLHYLRNVEKKDPVAPVMKRFTELLELRCQRNADVRFAWYRDGNTSGIIGGIVNPDITMNAILRSHEDILLVSGSLPQAESARKMLIPDLASFACIEVVPDVRSPVYLCPMLKYSYPLMAADHAAAVEVLQRIHKVMGATVLVFGQNRASNSVLEEYLRTRGLVSMMDSDMSSDWEILQTVLPDFVFASLGGRISESVNLPQSAFSCVVILSLGFRPATLYQKFIKAQTLAQETEESIEVEEDSLHYVESVSRIVQAVGRVQRDPQQNKPAFLLDKRFIEDRFIKSLPSHWHGRRATDWIVDSLDEVLQRARAS